MFRSLIYADALDAGDLHRWYQEEAIRQWELLAHRLADVKLGWTKENNDKGKSPNEDNSVHGLKLWDLNAYVVGSARIIDISKKLFTINAKRKSWLMISQ
jgi:hypothetical protein